MGRGGQAEPPALRTVLAVSTATPVIKAESTLSLSDGTMVGDLCLPWKPPLVTLPDGALILFRRQNGSGW